MPLSDTDIAAALADVLDGELTLPYPGDWGIGPDGNGRTRIAVDEGLSSIVVDREDGTVLLVGPDGDESVINSSPDALAEFAARYSVALQPSSVPDDEDEVDEFWEAAGEELLERFRGIDPVAVEDAESFWSVAAEELGYGMHAPS
ncbi:SUKH-4 family immunity protein [Cryptosporangium sp. NPDC048952]|uniref:SUKH-4 family immunity protein n=1 Tax=Cryptosporangium sp. NPDC048952 TaxID=3363961 RepID=UPI0037153470